MRRRTRVISGGLALLAIAGLAAGFILLRDRPRDDALTDEALVVHRLRGLMATIEDIADEQTPPPVESEALVSWLTDTYRRGDEVHPAVDQQKGIITDVWGNRVVVLAMEDALWGLASPGRNGTWDDGGKDDIVVVRGAEVVEGAMQRLARRQRAGR